MRRIAAADIERGIRFRVAERLRIFQDLGERAPGLGHRREDVVRRAVDDAPERFDAIAREALAQHANDRHAAAHGRLVIDIDAGGFRGREDLGAVDREERLVRGDDLLARRDRGHHRVARVGDAAHELAHDLDVVALDRGVEIGDEERVIDLDHAMGLPAIADADRANFEPRAEPGLDRRGVIGEQLDHTTAHVAEAEQCDTDGSWSSHPGRLYE